MKNNKVPSDYEMFLVILFVLSFLSSVEAIVWIIFLIDNSIITEWILMKFGKEYSAFYEILQILTLSIHSNFYKLLITRVYFHRFR